MTAPTNWPNPERPGLPLFPERSGRHHVGDRLLFWYSDIQQWVTVSPIRACKEPEDFSGDKYHGPVLTPMQIAEMLAGERERCAKACEHLKPSMDEVVSNSFFGVRGAALVDASYAIRNLRGTSWNS